MKNCTIVFNTRAGYVMQPIQCRSISAALRLARESGLAYRIFIDGKLYKRGWIA